MFLKRLTLKGFKSFADPTSLEFEPGVTAVVGPNGSGKSNVVDAVTWVLGAQSTRALRSSRMEDVIFAGTANRAALGRAEVALTLDNASGRLAIDGAEVTISRTLFRNGDSEYAINGTVCRLLDVQELLGDSGVGRQQHMIIGQGQLDSVLNSRPEERRAVIEEAAGVLKHRRRKERAERRLEATHENLERLGDLVREIRRQMRPLQRQAVAAQSFADIEGELREAQRYQFALRMREFQARRAELEDRLGKGAVKERELRHELVALDARAAAAAVELSGHREEALANALARLEGLSERARGLSTLIAERQRGVRVALVAAADENVIATLEADSAGLAAELVTIAAEEATLAAERAEAEAARSTLAEAVAQFDATWGAEAAGFARSELAGARARGDLLDRAIGEARAADAATGARAAEVAARLAFAADEREALSSRLGDTERAVVALTRDHDIARAHVERAIHHRHDTGAKLRSAGERSAKERAHADALARALAELSGREAGELVTSVGGVLGVLADLVEVTEGYEPAVQAAAGVAGAGVVADSVDSARDALDLLRHAGGSGVVLPALDGRGELPAPPAGCESLRGAVRPRGDQSAAVTTVLDALFGRVFVAPSFERALELAATAPELEVVTRAGDRFGPGAWRVASGRAFVTTAAVAEAEELAQRAAEGEDEARTAFGAAVGSADEAQDRAAGAANALARAESERDQLKGAATAHGARTLALEADLRAVEVERAELAARTAELVGDRAALADDIAALELRAAESVERERWADEARSTVEAHRAQVRDREIALLRHETSLAERRRIVERRRGELESRLADHETERRAAATRRERLESDLAALASLGLVVVGAGEQIAQTQSALAMTYREQLEATRAGADELDSLRRQRTVLESGLAELSESSRRDEIEQAELTVKVDNLRELIRRELNAEPESISGAREPALAAGVTVEQRVAELAAQIGSLGPINPLALEELHSLEERHQELEDQVADVRHARRELLEVLRTLDQEIMATFSAACADVNEHFSALIAMLFPGGQGRLILTAPEDPLNTGVEIEVRPLGRNVRRISLLSGGERSMAALAFLFAVFRSRPSPFYMMDEVEAALDDVNLQRFLSLIDEFRDEAQLLIVTHQKRTMEAADALYGVTIAPGGSSRVVSQRVPREAAAAS